MPCISVSLLFRESPCCWRQIPCWFCCGTWVTETIVIFISFSGKLEKKIEVELAIKYVWHLLFNFACNFLVHWWGFSDIVIWHFIVQGLPLWVAYWFYCSDLEAWVCCQPPGLLITRPSEFIFGEAFVSQIKTLLELKVVADGYLWIFFFFFFTWSRDLSKTGILNLYLSGTSLTVMCTTSCDLENWTVLESCQVMVLEDWCYLPTLVTAAAFVMCQRRKTAPKAEDLLQIIVQIIISVSKLCLMLFALQ